MLPPQTVLPRAIDMPEANGNPRNTTALMNPMWDRFYSAIADAEGQVPDAQGVTHLSIGGKGHQTFGQPITSMGSLQDAAAPDYDQRYNELSMNYDPAADAARIKALKEAAKV